MDRQKPVKNATSRRLDSPLRAATLGGDSTRGLGRSSQEEYNT